MIPQVVQVPPPEPQLASERATQVFPAQQPLAHEVASHTQLPETQTWPEPHAAPAPHAHAPAAVHESAREELHVVQAPPAEPHLANEGETHVAPSQQPLGHEVASQTHTPA